MSGYGDLGGPMGPPQWEPTPPPGQPPGGSGPATPPGAVRYRRPQSLDLAVMLMNIGGVLALVNLLSVLFLRSEVEKAVRDEGLALTEDEIDLAINIAIGMGIFMGAIGAVLWFWMAWANGEGKSWARVTATVFFALSAMGFVFSFAQPQPVASRLIQGLSFLIGLGAVIYMYRPDSGAYYAYRAQLRNAQRYPGYG